MATRATVGAAEQAAQEARAGQAPPRRGLPSRRLGGARASEARLAAWLLLPAVLVMAVIVGYPVLYAVYLSLFEEVRFREPDFVLFENYMNALTNGRFWETLYNTTWIAVVSVVLELAIGLAMALIMHRAFRGRGLVRTAVLVPWAIPTAVSALLWAWMYQPLGGIMTAAAEALPWWDEVVWTGPGWARWAVVIADVWKTAPFVALLLLAGLQVIPEELHEAARVDGATAWQRFRAVTLPLLKGALLVALVFRVLDVLRIFDLPLLLTGGANDTETLSILAYQESITRLHVHYGSALSTLTFFYIMLAAFVIIRGFRFQVVRSARYEEGA